ncbi:hypothetical protein JCM16303_005241 [Sporobolomyces ruberrimus]
MTDHSPRGFSDSTSAFFAPPPSSSTDDRTRIVDFSGGSPRDGGDGYEPGSRFESTPHASLSPPSFSFTSFASTSNTPYASPLPEYTPSFSSSRTTPVLPTILPIPFPSSSSSPSTSPKLPAYSSKSPRGLRVDSSPTSPSRAFPPSSPFHAFLLRTIPHSFLPEKITRPQPYFQYPKSPSLLRPHPTTRHPLNSSINKPLLPSSTSSSWTTIPKRWIVSISFVLFLILGFSTLPSFTSSPSTMTSSGEGSYSNSIGSDLWRKAKEWEAWRGITNRNETDLTTKISISPNVNYLEEMEIVRNGGKRIEVKEGEEGGGKGEVKGNHHSQPSNVVPNEQAEEQAVLDAVVEEAKKLVETEAIEAALKPASAAETIQKVVLKPHSNDDDHKKPLPPVVKAKKDPSRYKRLLPLKAPSRRYLYGANFIPTASDKVRELLSSEGNAVEVEVEDPEYTNKKIKVPSKKTLEKLFRENKKSYEAEEEGWREFEWEAPEADQSLHKFVEKLSTDELSLRAWIRDLHSLPTASGVGLGSSPSTPFPPTSPSTSLSLLSSTVPSFNGKGKREKYDQLVVQAREGFEGKCQGSNWLESYGKMHREMLEGKRKPKFISYHCEKGMNCGGLGDRLLGMTSAFFFGLITQRSFLGEWQSPIPLDVVFDSPAVNWSYSSFTSASHPVLGQQSLVDQAAELDIIHFDRLSVDSTFGSTSWNPKKDKPWTKGFEKRDIAYASNWIKFFTNRGMIFRSFSYKHLQKSINKLGLEPTTAFACINQYLFRPKRPALNLISEYTSVLALPSVFSVGIHVRTGDRSMKDSEYDKVNTVKRHSQFFRCARELGETYATPSQQIVYYLVTDSANLKQDARQVLGSKVVTTDMVPQHVHQKSGHVDGVFSAVVEDWILSKTDMMVATQDSGFGKLASFMHGKENTTVTIFPRFNEDVNGLISKKSHLKVDCTDPNVFTTFEELSSEWSLG